MARDWKEVTIEDGDVWDKQNPLEGEFLTAEHEVGPNKSSMYTIRTEKGNVKVWGSIVLDDKLMSVPQGTYVRLEYEGQLTGKTGSKYHGYKVFFDANSTPKE